MIGRMSGFLVQSMPWCAVIALFAAMAPFDAQALPVFARQTGQNCVACHAGGQFPELTPYGRMFKMTGYTIGERQTVPLSIMYGADYARVRDTGKSNSPVDDFSRNGVAAVGGGSLFLAGRVADNIGVFIQDTYNNYAGRSVTPDGGNGKYLGHSAADYVDLRYADRLIDADRDLIFGVSLNNRPTGTDPSSAAPAWMQYVPGTSVSSRFAIDANGPYNLYTNNLAGINLYMFLNRAFYAELGFYQTANRWKSFLTSGTPDANTPHLQGSNPYWRLAYSHEWGPHNILAGTTGMIVKQYDNPSDTSNGTTVSRTKTIGLDAQYQYLLDPHTVTAQLAYQRQTATLSASAQAANAANWAAGGAGAGFVDALNNPIVNAGGNPVAPVDANGNPIAYLPNTSNTTNVFRAKLSYIYKATYGGSISFFNRSGTTNPANMQTVRFDPTNTAVNSPIDSTVRVTGNVSGNPAMRGFTYEAFWMPVQYVRIGAQYTMYSKYNGAATNYDGRGRDAKDNNTLLFYVWGAY